MWTSKADSRSLRLFVWRVPEDGLHEVAHMAANSIAEKINQHRYFGPPNYGSYDDFWLISPTGEVGDDFGPEFDEALSKLYGPGGRKLAFPHY